MELTKTQWTILNALADGDEPIEEVFSECNRECAVDDPQELLGGLFALFKEGYITIRQSPIRALGQKFQERAVVPSAPQGILGDMFAEFEQFRAKKSYTRSVIHDADGPTGIPLGIYIDMTPEGREEWGSPKYRNYWAKEDD